VKSTASLPFKARRIKQHLDSLERSNYTGDALQTGFADAAAEQTNEGSMALATLKKRKGKADQSVAVKMLLMYRKNLSLLVEESVRFVPHLASYHLMRIDTQGLAKLSGSTPSYLTAAAPAPSTPPLRLCSVCGYKGIHRCVRCGMEYCDLNCKFTHDETRCERRGG
jgi:zinc finger HIT domain-containing protein 1